MDKASQPAAIRIEWRGVQFIGTLLVPIPKSREARSLEANMCKTLVVLLTRMHYQQQTVPVPPGQGRRLRPPGSPWAFQKSWSQWIGAAAMRVLPVRGDADDRNV